MPVLFSDADYSHRFGVKWLYEEDIMQFLQDELYGETWDVDLLHEAILAYRTTGTSIVDPAKLVTRPSDYANFRPPPASPTSRPHEWCPKV